MADRTMIEWTDATWNPIRGCSRVSEGCRHCYAETVAARFSGPGQPYEGLAHRVRRPDGGSEARWTGKIAVVESAMDQPLRWRRPRRIFVNSMSDLFHDGVPDEVIDRVFRVMSMARHHTFQVLTKRPERMRRYLTSGTVEGRISYQGRAIWPLPNVWLGVSVEDQRTADERIPILLDTPAAVPWISAEPLIGPLDLTRYFFSPLDFIRGLGWVVVGGESGPGARPMHPDWARSLRDQCATAGVPFLFKQWGEWRPRVGYWEPKPFGIFPDGSHYRSGLLMGPINEEAVAIGERHAGQTYVFIHKVGKSRAGRLLDGVLHDAYPAETHLANVDAFLAGRGAGDG